MTEQWRRNGCTLTLSDMNGIIKLLLTIPEDKATLRSDLSAVYGVWQGRVIPWVYHSFLFSAH